MANDLTPSLFFANQGDGTFRDIGVQSGLVLDEGGVAFAGMGIDAAYINNDAQLCVAIGNFAGQPTTLHCQVRAGTTYHSEVFTEQSHRAGLAGPTLRMVTFGVFFFDADLDGLQDLFMVNGHVANEERLRNVPYAQPPQLFRNRGDGTFAEVTALSTGLAWIDVSLGEGPPTRIMIMTEIWTSCSLPIRARPICCAMIRHARGLSTGGDTGHAQQSRWYRSRLWLYTTAQRRLSGMVRTGGSYLSHSELPVTFGLQPGEAIERLEIAWPSGTHDVFRGLHINSTFMAREGEAPGPGLMAQQPNTLPVPAGSRAAQAHGYGALPGRSFRGRAYHV